MHGQKLVPYLLYKSSSPLLYMLSHIQQPAADNTFVQDQMHQVCPWHTLASASLISVVMLLLMLRRCSLSSPTLTLLQDNKLCYRTPACPPLKPTSPHPQPSYVHMPSLRGYIWHVPFSSCWCMSLHSQTCHHCVQKLHDNKTKGCNCLHPEGVCHCTQRQYVIGRRGCMSLPLVGRPCIHRVVCHYIQRLWLSKAVHHCSQGFHVIASKD